MMPQDRIAVVVAAVLGGMFAGFLCGGICFALAAWQRRLLLGTVALLVCTAAGGILGVFLAGPVALVFAIVLLVLGRQEAPSRPRTRTAREEPTDLFVFLPPGSTAAARTPAPQHDIPALFPDPRAAVRRAIDDANWDARHDTTPPPRRPPVSPAILVVGSLAIVVAFFVWSGMKALDIAAKTAEEAATQQRLDAPRIQAERERKRSEEINEATAKANAAADKQRLERAIAEDRIREEAAAKFLAEQVARERAREKAAQEERQTQETRRDQTVKPLAEIHLPAAEVGAGSLAVERKRDDKLTWTVLPYEVRPENRPRPESHPLAFPQVAGAIWAADGTAFFVLARDGRLSKVAYPDLREVRHVDLGSVWDSLGTCWAGLVATSRLLEETWTIDPETLSVGRRFGIRKLVWVSTGRDLAYGYVFSSGKAEFVVNGAVRDVGALPIRIDFHSGAIEPMTAGTDSHGNRYYPPRPESPPALSPDGRWLFLDARGSLKRFRMDGTSLVFDEQTREKLRAYSMPGVCVSSDGRWVSRPDADILRNECWPANVYRAADLSRPAFVLEGDACPAIVGFDPIAKRVFCQTGLVPLVVVDEAGTLRTSHSLGIPPGRHSVRQFAAHPTDGRGLLVVTYEKAILVEFDGSGKE